MTTPPAPSTKPRCEQCNEHRYVISADSPHGARQESLAYAKRCEACAKVCGRCGGEHFIFLKDERGYRYTRECPECQPLERRIKAFNEAKLPARYKDKSFETFETGTDLLARIKLNLFRMARSFIPGDRGLLLYGPPGSGKTHILSAFIHEITLNKGVQTRFIEFSHLLSALRQQFDVGRGDTDVIVPLIEVDVLAIDELGKGVNNEWQLSVLDELISKRYNLGRTTFLTSNYLIQPEAFTYQDFLGESKLRRATTETLAERVGDRIFSRLFEMTDFIEVKAPDFRRRQLRLLHEDLPQ